MIGVPEEARKAAETLEVEILDAALKRALMSVWNARSSDEDVALVVLDTRASETERRRFASALERMRDLAKHVPGVLRVRAIAPGGDAFVADRAEGSLHDLRALRWPLRRKIEFMRRLVKTLEATHEAGLVHGSLSPANVLLDRDFQPVLAEIGMVSVTESFDGDPENVFGYGPYAAPELSASMPDARSDVYSVGRLFADVLLDADASTATTVPPEVTANVRGDVVAIMRRCAHHSPAERYQSMHELLAALEGLSHLDAAAAPRVEIRKATPAVAFKPIASAQEAPSFSFEPLRVPAAALGALLVVLTLPLAWFVGCETEAMRSLFQYAVASGVGLAMLLLPAHPTRPHTMRAVLVIGAAAAVIVSDPLFFLHRAAAIHRLAGNDESRAKATTELVQLGRDLRGAHLGRLNLVGIDLRGADLRDADLAGTNLSRANLFGALLNGAAMGGARIDRAELEGATLEGARDLAAAECDPETHFPSGWRCVGGHPTQAAAPQAVGQ